VDSIQRPDAEGHESDRLDLHVRSSPKIVLTDSTALFRGDAHIRCLAGSSSLSWPFCIDIATL
jgi:hypothetical protein